MKTLTIFLLLCAAAWAQNIPPNVPSGLLINRPTSCQSGSASQQYWATDGTPTLYVCSPAGTWNAVGGGGGGGGVSSVGVTLPTSLVACTGSPVTSSGTIACTFATGQTANQVLRTGSGTVAFGALTLADLPAISCGNLSNGAASCSTDTTNAANISSGTLPAARLPNPSASTLGGIESAAAVTHEWINSISTSGVPALSQPAFTDVSGSATQAQLPTTISLPPYLQAGGNLYIPADNMYQAVLPTFSGWTQLAGTSTQAAQTNGNYININTSSTPSFFQQTASLSSSIESAFFYSSPASEVSLVPITAGLYICDSTNNKIYEVKAGNNVNYSSLAQVETYTVSSCTSANTPAFAATDFSSWNYAPYPHFKISWAAGTATFSSSTDGGSSYKVLGTVSVGTIASSGIYQVSSQMNVFSLKVQ